MGVDILIKRLREHKDEQIKQLWHEAEKKATAIQKEYAESTNALLDKKSAELAVTSGKEGLHILKKAAQRSNHTVLAGQEKLLQRTYALARQSLDQLRDGQYSLHFASLVNEIPKLPWQQIAVHPNDSDLASQYFPEVPVKHDETISGGFLLNTQKGAIEIDNTFEKRLEKIWPQIAPSLLEEIYQQFKLHHDLDER